MNHQNLAVLAALSTVAVASALDIRNDLAQGADPVHLLSEAVVVLVALVTLVGLVMNLRTQSRLLSELTLELETAKAESARADPETKAARQRLGDLIRQQFRQWELTASEQEVALLMLKGLSFKEIATLRNTLEKTVRQQASTIYRKANVSGRHTLAAWFIEDFL